ncbi:MULTISPECIES: hypothetical protein [unclassified Acinetobacter]|jgi:hypothetical protein|uniref:hypothetical protein n=1 Tax=unclassified Acinetobacter TaxID=196816 RepID=UPI0002CFB8CA|nr:MULTISPECIES: hypothetical protein [unclassified Acinetobacter]ENW84514.1 hypothetical protein F908_00562 [Acinetobacter sp. NIPH 284]NWK80758.1 hypothetical protein [Acinetobacter sp. SwsAc4]WPC36473.1 hypothetical protein O4M77_15580 [Acinetobacter sp. YWS30-1]
MKPIAKLGLCTLLIVGTFNITGCSVFMAAKQPEKKDTKMLAVGVPRAVILAEFGAPVSTVKNGDETVDIFSFKQGYGKAAKFGRMMFHGVADVATLGLWEIIGTPVESGFDGNNIAYQITYDQNDNVKTVVQLKK